MTLNPGLRAEVEHVVAEADTAAALGGGDVPVLATPRLLALAEAASVAAVSVELNGGQTTVSTRAQLDHLHATPVGATVRVSAGLVDVDGRTLQFEVMATDADGTLVARGEVTRVLVDRDRFLEKLA
jgi:fluoroacetyl-CoA thioesterase